MRYPGYGGFAGKRAACSLNDGATRANSAAGSPASVLRGSRTGPSALSIDSSAGTAPPAASS